MCTISHFHPFPHFSFPISYFPAPGFTNTWNKGLRRKRDKARRAAETPERKGMLGEQVNNQMTQ